MRPGRQPPKRLCSAPSLISVQPRCHIGLGLVLKTANTMLQGPNGDFTRLPSPGWGRAARRGLGSEMGVMPLSLPSQAAIGGRSRPHWCSAQALGARQRRHNLEAQLMSALLAKMGRSEGSRISRVLLGVLVLSSKAPQQSTSPPRSCGLGMRRWRPGDSVWGGLHFSDGSPLPGVARTAKESCAKSGAGLGSRRAKHCALDHKNTPRDRGCGLVASAPLVLCLGGMSFSELGIAGAPCLCMGLVKLPFQSIARNCRVAVHIDASGSWQKTSRRRRRRDLGEVLCR